MQLLYFAFELGLESTTKSLASTTFSLTNTVLHYCKMTSREHPAAWGTLFSQPTHSRPKDHHHATALVLSSVLFYDARDETELTKRWRVLTLFTSMEKISNINSYAEEKNPTHSAAIFLFQSIQPPTSKQLATNKAIAPDLRNHN